MEYCPFESDVALPDAPDVISTVAPDIGSPELLEEQQLYTLPLKPVEMLGVEPDVGVAVAVAVAVTVAVGEAEGDITEKY